MDIKEIEKVFNEIVARRNELSQLDYSAENYDDLEDELHDLEDDFNEEYGEFLEDLLDDIHEEIKVDSDVLLPTAYILKKYVEEGKGYDLNPDEDGVFIEVEGYAELNTRLMLLPDPLRVSFSIEGAVSKEWEVK